MARQLTRSSPFIDLSRFDPMRLDPFRGFEETLRELMPSLRGIEAEMGIRLDVQETDQAYQIKADLPGMKKEDIQVSVDGNQVTIEAKTAEEQEEKKEGKLVRRERYVGQQYRSFSLPQDIDDQSSEAHYENGVLALTLPKRTGGASKTLAIR